MAMYHIKVVNTKTKTEKPHPCDGYTVTLVPDSGYYAENSHIIGVPDGQKIKIETELMTPQGMKREIILIPQDGRKAYIMDGGGNTIDSYPRKSKEKEKIDTRKELSFRG